MKKYGCTGCNEKFDTFEEALPHHNQITGHNVCTPPMEECPSCAALRSEVERLKRDAISGRKEVDKVCDLYRRDFVRDLVEGNKRLRRAVDWALSDEGMNLLYSPNGPKKYFSELRRRTSPTGG